MRRADLRVLRRASSRWTTRIVRFHNIYGPYGTYDGGREKAPAAMCRKVALAEDGGSIEIWGDGEQTRSFCYIDDCVEGIYRLMHSDYAQPLNLGTDRMVTINELAQIVMDVAGKRLSIVHVDGPAGRAGPQLRQHPAARGARLGTRRSSSRKGSPRPTAGSRSRWPSASDAPSLLTPQTDGIDPPRVDVLGVGISAVDPTTAVDEIGGWIDERRAALRLRDRRARRDGVAARRRAAGHPQRGRA